MSYDNQEAFKQVGDAEVRLVEGAAKRLRTFVIRHLWMACVVLNLINLFWHWSMFAFAALVVFVAWAAMMVANAETRTAFGADLLTLWAWVRKLSARVTLARDTAPSYWATPARDENHAYFRKEYERIANLAERSDADYSALAEVLRRLRNYGDDVLAMPPAAPAAVQGLLGASVVTSAVSGGLFGAIKARGTAILLYLLAGSVAAAALATGAAVKFRDRERDALAEAREQQQRAASLEDALAHSAQALAQARVEREETRTLNETIAARADRLEARLRRSNAQALDAARTGDAPDLTGRLRDLASPASADLGGPPPPAPDASGVPDGGAPG